jgi:hypothetical protein
MKEGQAYGRLMGARHDSQAQIEAEVSRRRAGCSGRSRTAANPVETANVDSGILFTPYRPEHSELPNPNGTNTGRRARTLAVLNECLANLGAEPAVVPDHLPAENLHDLILAASKDCARKKRFDSRPHRRTAIVSTSRYRITSFPLHRPAARHEKDALGGDRFSSPTYRPA